MGVHVPNDVILKKRSTMEVHVPHDVVLNHILPRAPAKSVYRFKCVSKEWHSFLTSKLFKSMHMDHHQNNIKLVVISKSESSFEFTTIDCEAPSTDKGSLTRRPLPPFERITPYNIRILASFHGLVCLGTIYGSGNYFSDLILWNPLTNEYRRLSKSNYSDYYSSNLGLYYSSCEDDYKLLLITDYYESKVYVYSFKSDSWRNVDAFQHRILLHDRRWSRATYFNESLYFLQPRSNEGLSSIIRFDTKTERLSKIETPTVDDYQTPYSETIMVKRGCIYVCVKYDICINCDNGFGWTTCIKLWKLDEHDNLKEVVNYQLKPRDYIIPNLRPFHLMKNGSWLMIYDCNKECYIYKVDLKEKKHIKDKSGKDKGNIYDDYELSASIRVEGINGIFADNVGYIETFVSPNQHMK